ncbi:MAG: hypothetical protein COZ21_16185 [Bacteroidetes bacterium CG_4_10_14_3_um_filter_31_20]|nr:MAG: hypothetical protein COZ21_16185 [Bacteroidetes bacterium CG_4_10_14_3_um_filter_31_20]
MKKILLFTLVSLFAIFIATSCTKDCKKCKSVTTNNTDNSVVPGGEGSSSEYCDTALDEKESAEPVTDGSTTTKWVCE